MPHHAPLTTLVLASLANFAYALTPPQTYCLAASPDGKYVAANIGGGSGVQVFDLQTGKELAHMDSATPEGAKARQAALPMLLAASFVRQIKFTPGAKSLDCTTYASDAAIIIWNLQHTDKPAFIQSEGYTNCDDITLSSDGKQWLTYMHASPNGADFFIAFDADTAKELWRRSLGADKVRDARFSDSGNAVRIVDARGNSTWQDPKTGNPLPEPAEKPAAPQFELTPPRVSHWPNEPFDTTLKLTDLSTRKETILDAKGEIKAAILIPNNVVIAEVSQGLRVWDAKTGKLPFNLGDPDYVPPKGGLFGE